MTTTTTPQAIMYVSVIFTIPDVNDKSKTLQAPVDCEIDEQQNFVFYAGKAFENEAVFGPYVYQACKAYAAKHGGKMSMFLNYCK